MTSRKVLTLPKLKLGPRNFGWLKLAQQPGRGELELALNGRVMGELKSPPQGNECHIPRGEHVGHFVKNEMVQSGG